MPTSPSQSNVPGQRALYLDIYLIFALDGSHHKYGETKIIGAEISKRLRRICMAHGIEKPPGRTIDGVREAAVRDIDEAIGEIFGSRIGCKYSFRVFSRDLVDDVGNQPPPILRL